MAETTADVRRDIELTRERMSSTLAQLERKVNLTQIVKDNPWPALGVAFGAGVLLSGSQADVKAAAATAVATRGASSKLGTVLDDVVANLMAGLTDAFHGHIDTLVSQVKEAIGAPQTGNGQPFSGAAARPSTGATTDGASSGFGASGFAAGSAGAHATGAGASSGASATNGGLTPSQAGSQGLRAD